MAALLGTFLVALVCSTTVVRSENCGSTLSAYEGCDCTFDSTNRKWTELNCKDRNFDFETSVRLLNLSGSTEALDNMKHISFTGNNLTIVPRNVLGNTKLGDFWDLETLDLSHNNIRNISGKSFHAAPELATLILSDNEWYVSDRTPRIFSSFFELKKLYLNNAFFSSQEEVQVNTLTQVFEGSELYWLEELYLERNKVEHITPALFQSLPSLSKLSLKNNHIKGTDYIWDSNCHERTYYTELFEETCVLTELDLSENDISTISMNLIEELMKMDTFTKLNIQYNPLHCDSQLKPFIDWMKADKSHKSKIVGADDLVCEGPKDLKHQKLLELNVKHLKSSGFGKSSGPSGATVALAVIFSILALILIVVLIMNRRAVIETTGKAVGSIRDIVHPRKYSYTGVNV